MNLKNKLLKSFILLILSQFYLPAFSNSLERVLQKGELVVGSDGTCLPYELRTPDGKWMGFEVDLMQAFANHLKIKIKFVDYNWDGLVPALITNKFDMIASDIGVTEEKSKTVLFTTPYYKVGVKAIILNENSNHYKNMTINDLNVKGLNIAVQMGTSAELMAKKYFNKANIIVFQNQDIASQALLFKKVDVLYYEENYLKQFVKMNVNKVQFISGKMGDLFLAAAARKNEPELVEEFNKFYNEWKNSEDYKKSYSINFEIMPWTNSKMKEIKNIL